MNIIQGCKRVTQLTKIEYCVLKFIFNIKHNTFPVHNK